ncbi:MAG TPA: response regulator transcription factor, partial [Candidatus Rubrimentiphilum sp.]|nr:response regulator transcription factor [Candidatus Rubrimentiphilum sp.]
MNRERERPLILAVDDHPEILAVLTTGLSPAEFELVTARSGGAALRMLDREPDCIVLDIMMPAIDGMEVLRRIREKSDVPVLFLTARNGLDERISGLRLGADDYIVKPFSIEELTARIRAALRRPRVIAQSPLVYEDLWLNPDDRTVRRAQRQIDLTPREFDLLHVLLRSPNCIFSRSQLLSLIWRDETALNPNNV